MTDTCLCESVCDEHQFPTSPQFYEHRFTGVDARALCSTSSITKLAITTNNLVMEDVEQRALASTPVNPSFWKRFVDDVNSAVSENEIDVLMQHLNSIEPSIQFTVERETDRKLAFLDTCVHRAIEGKLETDVHRKPTHTDKYLSFNSHHPRSHKKPWQQPCFREQKV